MGGLARSTRERASLRTMRLCALRALTSWAILMEMENTNKLAHASPRACPQARCHAGCKPLSAASDGIRPGVERARRGVGRDGGGGGRRAPAPVLHPPDPAHARPPPSAARGLFVLLGCLRVDSQRRWLRRRRLARKLSRDLVEELVDVRCGLGAGLHVE